MILCDVNILIYAYRSDFAEHEFYRNWLEELVNSRKSFAVSDHILSGFLRIVTHPRVFKTPSPFESAKEFADILRNHPNSMPVVFEDDHWHIFTKICQKAQVRGNRVVDAYLAAMAIGSGCSLATADRDFDRFSELKVVHPVG